MQQGEGREIFQTSKTDFDVLAKKVQFNQFETYFFTVFCFFLIERERGEWEHSFFFSVQVSAPHLVLSNS